eukprot:CAMPEP_0185796590 /NCGR_PEP_ID=MMETSP1174-20130828/161168_1 /TAXON_ID=35687 /ORGANISM="Dictyocha speculum, Strain CCMP1381" /LENGTH=212 /DNA_ID=CAMNT_0028491973 /DNA_START=577 /DNA_END=1212 /DNA_ORIENTATION=+
MKQHRTTVFIITYLCYLSLNLIRKPFSIAKAVLADEVPLTTSQLGGIDTAFLVMYACATFIIGPLGGLIGERTMIPLLLACAALSSLGVPASAGPSAMWGMTVGSALNGAAQSAMFSLCMSLLEPLYEPCERGKAMGMWATNGLVGGIVTSALTAFLLARFDWQMAFYVPACLVLVMAGVSVAVLGLGGGAPSAAPEADVHREGKDKHGCQE